MLKLSTILTGTTLYAHIHSDRKHFHEIVYYNKLYVNGIIRNNT